VLGVGRFLLVPPWLPGLDLSTGPPGSTRELPLSPPQPLSGGKPP